MSAFLQAILKREWDESRVTRAKTTPESTPGSFAPHAQATTPGGDATYTNERGVVVTSSVDDAVRALNEGREVELRQVRQVSVLLDKLEAIAMAAEARGEAAPVYDLCKVTVRGTNLFCVEALDVDRASMPQLRAKPIPGSAADRMVRADSGKVDATDLFLAHMTSKGYSVTHTTEGAAYLRATQRQLNGAKVGQMMNILRTRELRLPDMVISEDNYIIDGHHRWAGLVGVDASDNHLGDVTLPVIRVGIRIMDLLREANEFVDRIGLQRSGVKTSMAVPWLKKMADIVKEAVWNEALHPRHPAGADASRGGEFARTDELFSVNVIDTDYRTGKPSRRKIDVMHRPTYAGLKRLGARELRWLKVPSNNSYFVWDSYEGIHDKVLNALVRDRRVMMDDETEMRQRLWDLRGQESTEEFMKRAYLFKSWLQLVKDAVGWKEEEHPRGETTQGTNSGSFAPRDDRQGDLFGLSDSEVVTESLNYAKLRIKEAVDPADRIKAAEDYGKLEAWRMLHALETNPDVDEEIPMVGMDHLKDPTLRPMAEEYLSVTLRDDAVFEAHDHEVSEVVRQEHAFGDDELRDANRGWAEALDQYIGSSYVYINAYFRAGEIEIGDLNDDEYSDYYSQFHSDYVDEHQDELYEQRVAELTEARAEELAEFEGDDGQEAREAIEKEIATEAREWAAQEVEAGAEKHAKEMVEAVKEDDIRNKVREAEEAADEIKELIDSRPPTPRALILRRGVKTGESIDWDNLEPKASITLEGFTSTSSKKEAASRFGNRMIEFVVPAGSKDVLFTTNDGEGEVIFNHGAKVTVLSKKDDLLVLYYHPEGNGEGDDEEEEVEKAEQPVRHINFGRMHTEPKVITESLAKFDESQVHRAKTTPESNSGSFAPQPEGGGKITAEDAAPWITSVLPTVPVYHGTADDVLPYILKEGLRPGSETEIRRWGEDFYSTDERAESVYVVTTPRKAVVWANSAKNNAGDDDESGEEVRPIILRLEVPEDLDFADDELLDSMHKRFRGWLPAEWITGYIEVTEAVENVLLADYDSEMDIATLEGYVPKSAVAKATGRVMYTVIFVTGKKLKKSWLARLLKWSEDEHPRGETVEGTNKGSFRPRNMGFVSPNVDENVDFQEAASRVQSHRTKLLLEADEAISEYFGTQTHESVGVGAWADGAEQSIIVDGPGDFEAFKAHMAMSGLLAEQKAIIAFTNDAKGPDSVYRLSVGNRPLKEVHSALLEAGVQFHTLRKTDHNVDVFVFAPGTEQETQNAIAKAAEHFGVDEVDFVKGYGEFLGSWDSREEGRAAYEAVLDAYESKVPGRDGGWKEFCAPWRPKFSAVRKVQEQGHGELNDVDVQRGARDFRLRPGYGAPVVENFLFAVHKAGAAGWGEGERRLYLRAAAGAEIQSASDNLVVGHGGVAEDDRPHQSGPGRQSLGEFARGDVLREQPQPDLQGGDLRQVTGPLQSTMHVRGPEAACGVLLNVGSRASGVLECEGGGQASDSGWLEKVIKYSPDQPRGKTTPESNSGSFAPSATAPIPPGSLPIPEGSLRVYHYTEPSSLESVRQKGLLRANALGHTYGEPDLVWASAAKPGRHKHFVEFYVFPNELGIGGEHRQDKFTPEQIKAREGYGSDVTLLGDLPPERILAVHEPWHNTFYYLTERPDMIEGVLRGDHDQITADDFPDEARAIEYIKRMYGNVQKSWLEIVKDWDESKHPRGKTSPESTPGSFAPSKPLSDTDLKIQSWDDWRAAAIGQPVPKELILFRVGTRAAAETPINRNLATWDGILDHMAEDDFRHPDDSVFSVYRVRSEPDATFTRYRARIEHEGARSARGQAPRGGYESTIGAEPTRFGGAYISLLDAGHAGHRASVELIGMVPAKDLKDPQLKTVLRGVGLTPDHYKATQQWQEGLHVIAGKIHKEGIKAVVKDWDETKHPRGKTTPESNSGSFAPAAEGNERGGARLHTENQLKAKNRLWSVATIMDVKPEVLARAKAELKKVMAEARIAINRNSDTSVTDLFTGSGRMMTQFETGNSSGLIDPDRRAEVEHNLFGIPNDVEHEPEQRPVYGYLIHKDDTPYDDDYAQTRQYGKYRFVLKPEVNERATWTEDDSLAVGL